MWKIDDPAWFYSSIAQSAAAIVGLIAAIFGTRLIDHARDIAKERARLVALLAEVRRHFDNRVLGMTRYGPHLRQELAEDEAAIARGETERTPTRGMSWDAIEPREDRYRPEILINHRRALQNYLGLWERIQPAYTNLRGVISTRDLRDYVHRLRALADEISPETAPMNMLRADADGLEQVLVEVEAFRERAQPDHFSILRGFSVSVILVVFYFAFEVVRLWLLSRVSWGRGEPQGTATSARLRGYQVP